MDRQDCHIADAMVRAAGKLPDWATHAVHIYGDTYYFRTYHEAFAFSEDREKLSWYERSAAEIAKL